MKTPPQRQPDKPTAPTAPTNTLPSLRDLETDELVAYEDQISNEIELVDLVNELDASTTCLNGWANLAANGVNLGEPRGARMRRRQARRRSRDSRRAHSRCTPPRDQSSRAARSHAPLAEQRPPAPSSPGQDWLHDTLSDAIDLPTLAKQVAGQTENAPTDAKTAEDTLVRFLGLFVVRESDKHDLILFDGQREQTYLHHRDVSPVDAVRRAGLAPMTGKTFEVDEIVVHEDGTTERVKTTVTVTIETEGSTRAYVFEYGGYYHLWSQASAAKHDQGGRNEFTIILLRILRRIRPLSVFVNNLSRLIRDHSHGADLASSMRGNVDTIQIGAELGLDFVKEPDMAYMRLWMMGWCAAIERKWILQRLAAGRVAAARNGKWPLGHEHVPFGYMLDAKKHKLVPDLTKKAAVRAMMLILCDDSPTGVQAQALDNAGVTGSMPNRVTKEVESFSSRRNTGQSIRRFFSWAPVWCAGEYLMRLECGFDGLEEVAGVPIVRRPGEPDGELQLHCKVELPVDGWAEPEVLRAFAQRAMDYSVRAILAGTPAPRPLAAKVAIKATAPRLLEAIMPSSRIHDLSPNQHWIRDASRQRDLILPFSGTRWTEDDGYLYETQVNSNDLELRVLRWHLSSFPEDIDPVTGTRK